MSLRYRAFAHIGMPFTALSVQRNTCTSSATLTVKGRPLHVHSHHMQLKLTRAHDAFDVPFHHTAFERLHKAIRTVFEVRCETHRAGGLGIRVRQCNAKDNVLPEDSNRPNLGVELVRQSCDECDRSSSRASLPALIGRSMCMYIAVSPGSEAR